MAIGFIDALTHNSTVNGYGLVESDEIQGGIRTSVDNLFELAKLKHVVSGVAIGQLKEYSSIVFVRNTDPLTEAAVANGDNTITISIDGTDTFFEAPSTTNGIGKFYCLTDITLIETPNSEPTLIVTDDNGTLTAVPEAWTVLDALVGGGAGISDFSGVTFNSGAATIVVDPLVVGNGTLDFTFPTATEVAGIFNQGTGNGDSSVEIVDMPGVSIAAGSKRIQLKPEGQHLGHSLWLGTGVTTPQTNAPGSAAYKSIFQAGPAFNVADGNGFSASINANLTVIPNQSDSTLAGGPYAPIFNVTRQTGIYFGGNVLHNAVVTDGAGEITAENSIIKMILADTQLGVSTAVVIDSEGDVFKRDLGDLAFVNQADLPVGVTKLLPHDDPTSSSDSNIRLFTTNNGNTDSTGTGDIYINLNKDIQIGNNSDHATLTIGTSTSYTNQTTNSDPVNSLRVYGNTTIDGDLTVAGSLITTTEAAVTFEDVLLSVAVARDANGSISNINHSNITLNGAPGAGIEAFHGHGVSGGITTARPYIVYKYSSNSTRYGEWVLAHGYTVLTTDANGDPATYGAAEEGRILTSLDARVVPTAQQPDNRYLYHDMSATDAEEDTLKFITTPYGLTKKYSRTESFTYTPLGGASSTYNQTFNRSFARVSVVTATYGVEDSTSAPRPNGAIRLYHGLNLDDGFVNVVGIVTTINAASNLNLAVGSLVYPKVKVRDATGGLGVSNEYKNSCDVFVNGVVQGDQIKFIVMG